LKGAHFGANHKVVTVFEHEAERVVANIFDHGVAADADVESAGVHFVRLLDNLLLLRENTWVGVRHLLLGLACVLVSRALKKFTLHRSESLLLLLLKPLESFLDIIFNPAEVLLRGVTQGEDIVEVGEHVVLVLLDSGRGCEFFTIGIKLLVIVLDRFVEDEGVTGGEENFFIAFFILFSLLASFATFTFDLGVFVTLFFLGLVTVASFELLFFLVVCVLLNAWLINRAADEGQSIFDLAVSSHHFAMSDALINLGEQFAVLGNVDTGAPLVSNAEEDFLELENGKLLNTCRVINPFLGNLSGHFSIAVEGGQHTVHARN
jgi:hypothetical protein